MSKNPPKWYLRQSRARFLVLENSCKRGFQDSPLPKICYLICLFIRWWNWHILIDIAVVIAIAIVNEKICPRYAIILRRIVIHQRNLERRRRQQMKHKQAAIASSSVNGVKITSNTIKMLFIVVVNIIAWHWSPDSDGGRAWRRSHNGQFLSLLFLSLVVFSYPSKADYVEIHNKGATLKKPLRLATLKTCETLFK